MPLIDSLRMDQMFAHTARHVPAEMDPVLRYRARALAPEDRLLVELVYDKHLSVRQIARLISQSPGSVSRRVRRIRTRLYRPLIGALLDPACKLSADYREIGLEYFAQGRKMRSIAHQRNITLTQVRAVLDFIRGWHRGALRA